MNFVAAAWGAHMLQPDDEIVLTEMEHHSNLLPWLDIAKKTGARLKFIPVNVAGQLDYSALDVLINKKTRMVAFIHVSNALGTYNDVKKIIARARAVGAAVLLDSCQAIMHQKIDVQDLDVDFLAFSGHKMFGPTGIGVLYIRKSMHAQLPPYQVGGGMVFEADYNHYTWLPAPKKYEAGTLPLAEIIGLGATIAFINEYVAVETLKIHETNLIKQAVEGLCKIEGINILGPVNQLIKEGHLVSFTVDHMHPHDVAAYLDQYGIMLRSGHYCAQPLAKKLGIDGSLRLSVAAYNTEDEIAYFLEIMHQLLSKKPFGR